MRDLTKEFTIPNGVNSLNATASLDPFFGPFNSVEEAYDLVPEAKRAVGKIFAIYLDSTKSNVDLYYWITDSTGAGWRAIPLIPNIDTDRVISLGAITVNGSVVTIGLHSGGSNSVQINNAIYSRYESISFTTDAIISAGNFRKDIIEARADSTVFYLKKGVESTNPVPPAVTEGALFISEVLVTSTGVSAGALNSVVTDSTMKGDGTSGNPLGLSDAKNAEIAATQTQLANKLDKTTATNQSVASTVTFSNTVFVPKLILTTQTSNTTVSALWSDGTSVYFNGMGGTPKPLAFTTDVSGKVDKVTGSADRFALIKPDGNIKGDLPADGTLAKVLGVTSDNLPAKANTINFKAISTAVTNPTLVDLTSFDTDRVDFPNLNRIYFQNGSKWCFIITTEVV